MNGYDKCTDAEENPDNPSSSPSSLSPASSSTRFSRQAYVTLMTSESFHMGVTALLYSLAKVNCTNRAVVVLATKAVSRHTRHRIVSEAPLELRDRVEVRVIKSIGYEKGEGEEGGRENTLAQTSVKVGKGDGGLLGTKEEKDGNAISNDGVNQSKVKEEEEEEGGGQFRGRKEHERTKGERCTHVPSWGEVAYTKLHVWNLTEFEKVRITSGRRREKKQNLTRKEEVL